MPTLRGCIYGQAVGDALGVPYEFRPRGTFLCTGMAGHGSHNQPAGTWSDDTSMALAICDSYRELGRIDVDDIRARFVRWYREGAYTVDGLFDIGGTTARALDQGAGCAAGSDNGNGSLMRTVPLAFMDATDEEVRAVSAITHAHPTSTEACVRMVRVARALSAGESPAAVAGEIAARPVEEVRSGGYVLDTFDAALWCLATTSVYRDCVLAAVNLGGLDGDGFVSTPFSDTGYPRIRWQRLPVQMLQLDEHRALVGLRLEPRAREEPVPVAHETRLLRLLDLVLDHSLRDGRRAELSLVEGVSERVSGDNVELSVRPCHRIVVGIRAYQVEGWLAITRAVLSYEVLAAHLLEGAGDKLGLKVVVHVAVVIDLGVKDAALRQIPEDVAVVELGEPVADDVRGTLLVVGIVDG